MRTQWCRVETWVFLAAATMSCGHGGRSIVGLDFVSYSGSTIVTVTTTGHAPVVVSTENIRYAPSDLPVLWATAHGMQDAWRSRIDAGFAFWNRILRQEAFFALGEQDLPPGLGNAGPILMVRAVPGHCPGRPRAAATVAYAHHGPHIVAAEITLCRLQHGPPYDIRMAVVHELGHLLGLNHTVQNHTAMDPLVGATQPTLSPADWRDLDMYRRPSAAL